MMTTQDPLMRTLHPLCTCLLKDWLTGCLISTWMICMPPVSDLYAVQHTHRLPSLIVAHGTSHMTSEPLGPFVQRPAPIWSCHPEPIDGWLTFFHPSLVIPTPLCLCGGLSTSVPPSPLHPPLPLPLHLPTVSHLQTEVT